MEDQWKKKGNIDNKRKKKKTKDNDVYLVIRISLF